MRIVDSILAELDQEAATTRRILERIPNDKLAWTPHARSMNLGQLAMHIATVPGTIAFWTGTSGSRPSCPRTRAGARIARAVRTREAKRARIIATTSVREMTWGSGSGRRRARPAPRGSLRKSGSRSKKESTGKDRGIDPGCRKGSHFTGCLGSVNSCPDRTSGRRRNS